MLRLAVTILTILLSLCVISDAADAVCVEFSPDGRFVAAVQKQENSTLDLVLFDVSGGVPAKHIANADSIHSIRFSPDEEQICIAAKGVKGTASKKNSIRSTDIDLYTIYLDDSAGLRITYNGAKSPVYSSLGDSIAFISADGSLAAVDCDGSNFRIIMKKSPVRSISNWLPDEKSFETVVTDGGCMTICAFTPPARHHLVRLSQKFFPPKEALSPVLSPDASKLAYLRVATDKDGTRLLSVFVQSAGTPKLIAELKDAGNTTPALAWSPSENMLAVAAASVRLVDVKTGTVRELQ